MSSVVPVLVLVAATCTSCSPWFFTLQRDTDWPLSAKIISRHDLVEVDAGNAVTVRYPSRIAMRCQDITDGIFDTEVLLGDADSDTTAMVLLLRSTPHADTVHRSPSPVEIRVSTLTTMVITPDTTAVVDAPLPPPGTPFRVQVYTLGRTLRVSVACHDVGMYHIDGPSSEWITVAPAGGSTVRLIDPLILPVGYADRWQTR